MLARGEHQRLVTSASVVQDLRRGTVDFSWERPVVSFEVVDDTGIPELLIDDDDDSEGEEDLSVRHRVAEEETLDRIFVSAPCFPTTSPDNDSPAIDEGNSRQRKAQIVALRSLASLAKKK